MNESEKNIETCLPENILAEVASVPTDPQFVSLVNESLDPLKQQAVQQAGSDAYNEVVASHQPYTFTSQVAQMKSNLILLLRRFWSFPFGTGTLRSLSDMWAHYINRLQGSETYGIPSRLDQLTDLPSAPLLVADRKIDVGESYIPDGMWLAPLICSEKKDGAYSLIDNSPTPWAMVSVLPFYGLTALRLNCSSSVVPIAITMPDLKSLSLPELVDVVTPSSFVYQCGIEDTVELPKLKYYRSTTGGSNYFFSNLPNVEVISLPELLAPYGDAIMFMANNPELREIYLPKVTQIYLVNNAALSNNPKLEKIVFGDYPTITYRYGNNGGHDVVPKSTAGVYKDCPNLIRIEVRGEVNSSIYLNHWSPTLDSSNLQQFLQNFRSFIVLRLANRKTITALTLTLSAAVYNAVTGANSGWASQHTLADLGITDNDLTDLETELGITSATIYATWLDTYTGANGIHWDINKAN